jgi:hypothetical protein
MTVSSHENGAGFRPIASPLALWTAVIKHARQIANHESPRTTKLHDRTNDAISLDEIERILIWREMVTALITSKDAISVFLRKAFSSIPP